MTKKTFIRGAWSLTLDANEVYPENPGNGTPALVSVTNSKSGYRGARCASLNCVLDTGECDGIDVPPGVMAWLESMTDKVESFIADHS